MHVTTLHATSAPGWWPRRSPAMRFCGRFERRQGVRRAGPGGACVPGHRTAGPLRSIPSQASTPALDSFRIEQGNTQGAGHAGHPAVIARKGNVPARCPEVFARSKMERIERAHGVGFRKGLTGSFQHRRNQFQERDTCDERPRRSAMGIGQAPRVQPVPDLMLKQPAGDQRLVPKRSRWASVLGQEVGKRDRRIQLDQRSFRSLSSSSRRSRNGATGSAAGGAPPVATAGGVSHPCRTASASTASARIGLRVSAGGRSSATTRSWSETRTVSPDAASRT